MSSRTKSKINPQKPEIKPKKSEDLKKEEPKSHNNNLNSEIKSFNKTNLTASAHLHTEAETKKKDYNPNLSNSVSILKKNDNESTSGFIFNPKNKSKEISTISEKNESNKQEKPKKQIENYENNDIILKEELSSYTEKEKIQENVNSTFYDIKKTSELKSLNYKMQNKFEYCRYFGTNMFEALSLYYIERILEGSNQNEMISFVDLLKDEHFSIFSNQKFQKYLKIDINTKQNYLKAMDELIILLEKYIDKMLTEIKLDKLKIIYDFYVQCSFSKELKLAMNYFSRGMINIQLKDKILLNLDDYNFIKLEKNTCTHKDYQAFVNSGYYNLKIFDFEELDYIDRINKNNIVFYIQKNDIYGLFLRIDKELQYFIYKNYTNSLNIPENIQINYYNDECSICYVTKHNTNLFINYYCSHIYCSFCVKSRKLSLGSTCLKRKCEEKLDKENLIIYLNEIENPKLQKDSSKEYKDKCVKCYREFYEKDLFADSCLHMICKKCCLDIKNSRISLSYSVIYCPFCQKKIDDELLENFLNEDLKDELKQCSICKTSQKNKELFSNKKCSHLFCKSCANNLLAKKNYSSISKNYTLCPNLNCSSEIYYIELEKVLNITEIISETNNNDNKKNEINIKTREIKCEKCKKIEDENKVFINKICKHSYCYDCSINKYNNALNRKIISGKMISSGPLCDNATCLKYININDLQDYLISMKEKSEFSNEKNYVECDKLCFYCNKTDKIHINIGTDLNYYKCAFCKEISCYIHEFKIEKCFCFCKKCLNKTEFDFFRNNIKKCLDCKINYCLICSSFNDNCDCYCKNCGDISVNKNKICEVCDKCCSNCKNETISNSLINMEDCKHKFCPICINTKFKNKNDVWYYHKNDNLIRKNEKITCLICK